MHGDYTNIRDPSLLKYSILRKFKPRLHASNNAQTMLQPKQRSNQNRIQKILAHFNTGNISRAKMLLSTIYAYVIVVLYFAYACAYCTH